MMQVLIGHGCFSKFLYRIGRRENTMCDLCGEEVDDVLHTLRECPRWFALGDVLEAILESEEKWSSFAAFMENAMRDKEYEERRRDTTVSLPMTWIRTGRLSSAVSHHHSYHSHIHY
ncbi:hypothetical protein ACFW04_013503 [Cataglyphis niger]